MYRKIKKIDNIRSDDSTHLKRKGKPELWVYEELESLLKRKLVIYMYIQDCLLHRFTCKMPKNQHHKFRIQFHIKRLDKENKQNPWQLNNGYYMFDIRSFLLTIWWCEVGLRDGWWNLIMYISFIAKPMNPFSLS